MKIIHERLSKFRTEFRLPRSSYNGIKWNGFSHKDKRGSFKWGYCDQLLGYSATVYTSTSVEARAQHLASLASVLPCIPFNLSISLSFSLSFNTSNIYQKVLCHTVFHINLGVILSHQIIFGSYHKTSYEHLKGFIKGRSDENFPSASHLLHSKAQKCTW